MSSRPPEAVRERDLPSWAQRVVDALRAPLAETRRRHAHLPDRSVGRERLLLYLLFVGGLAATLWALFGLRTGSVVPWRWGAGIGVVLLSAAGLAARTRAHVRLADGAVLAPEGLLWVEGVRYRALAREHIRAVTLDGDVLSITHDDGAWVLMRATPSTAEARKLAEHRDLLERWLAGELIADARLMPPFPDRRAATIFAKHVAVAAAASLFFWLVAVVPATGDAGVAVRSFVEAIAAEDFDRAHELLSPAARARIDRDALPAHLPDELQRATGIAINSVRGSLGTVAEASTCVDGYLDGLEGYSGFAFALIETDDGPRIESWRSGQCR